MKYDYLLTNVKQDIKASRTVIGAPCISEVPGRHFGGDRQTGLGRGTRSTRRSLVMPALVITLLCAIAMPAGAQTPRLDLTTCTAGLVPSELKTSQNNNLDDAFKDALCGDWYAQHKDLVDNSFSANGNYLDVIAAGVDTKNKSRSQSMTRVQYCGSSDWRVLSSTQDSFWSRMVTDSARQTWLGCIQAVTAAYTAGLVFHPLRLATTTSDAGITISVRFDSSAGAPP